MWWLGGSNVTGPKRQPNAAWGGVLKAQAGVWWGADVETAFRFSLFFAVFSLR